MSDVARENDSLLRLSAVEGLLPGAACMQPGIRSSPRHGCSNTNGSVRRVMYSMVSVRKTASWGSSTDRGLSL